MTDAELNTHPFPVQLRALDVHDHRDQLREMSDALHHATVILRILERDEHLPADNPFRLGRYDRRALCFFAGRSFDQIAAGADSDTEKFTDRIFGQIRAQAQKMAGEEEA